MLRLSAFSPKSTCSIFTSSSLSFASTRFSSSNNNNKKKNVQDKTENPQEQKQEQEQENQLSRLQQSTMHMQQQQQMKQTNRQQQQQMLDPNAAFLVRSAQSAVKSGRATPQAAAYFEQMYRNLNARAIPVVERARELVGDQDPENLSAYQRSSYSTILQHQAGNVIADHTKEMFQEQKGMQEFAQEGKPTGENYWFEAGGTLTSPDLPRDLKDDLFDEMKKDRNPESGATKDTGF